MGEAPPLRQGEAEEREEEQVTTYRDRHLAGVYAAPDAEQDRTVAELKDALKVLGQPVSGSKAELEKRLEKAQAEEE